MSRRTAVRSDVVCAIGTDPKYASGNPFEDLLNIIEDMTPAVMPAARKDERLLGFMFALSFAAMRAAGAAEDAGWSVRGGN